MDIAVKIFKGIAAMSDHRARERGHRFRGNLNRPGSEKLVVRLHDRILIAKRPGANLQLRLFLDEADIAAAFEPRDLDFFEVLSCSVQPQVFFEIVR